MPEHLKTGEVRQQCAAFGAEFFKVLLPLGLWIDLEGIESRPQRPPFQPGNSYIIDDVVGPQMREQILVLGIGPEFGKFFDIDIQRVEEQAAVR